MKIIAVNLASQSVIASPRFSQHGLYIPLLNNMTLHVNLKLYRIAFHNLTNV